MRVLVTGSSGQLGKAIINQKPKDFKLLLPKRNELDLSDQVNCRNYIEKYQPKFIINCGAFTNVDLAEKEQELCFAINTVAPSTFAEVLKEYGGNFLQISTDYVFDGCKNSPYEVKDTKNPISKYGHSKAICEQNLESILRPNNQLIILRTSWLVSPHRKNFLLTMLKLHKEKKCLHVVSDQIGAMSSTFNVAKVCWLIINNWNFISKNNFINHWTCNGITSWYDIAIAIGDIGSKLKLIKSPAEVIPIKTKNYPSIANRPLYSILDCTKTKEILNIKGKYWRHELEDIISKLKIYDDL